MHPRRQNPGYAYGGQSLPVIAHDVRWGKLAAKRPTRECVIVLDIFLCEFYHNITTKRATVDIIVSSHFPSQMRYINGKVSSSTLVDWLARRKVISLRYSGHRFSLSAAYLQTRFVIDQPTEVCMLRLSILTTAALVNPLELWRHLTRLGGGLV